MRHEINGSEIIKYILQIITSTQNKYNLYSARIKQKYTSIYIFTEHTRYSYINTVEPVTFKTLLYIQDELGLYRGGLDDIGPAI